MLRAAGASIALKLCHSGLEDLPRFPAVWLGRRKMSTVRWVLGVLFVVKAIAGEPTIWVRVYNAANVPQSNMRKSLAEAAWILRQAGVKTHWVECGQWTSDGAGVPGCVPRGGPGQFALSLLAEDPRQDTANDALGFAVLTGGRNGAAVIFSRVASMRKDYPEYADCDITSAVIAHELGHLLLSSSKHGDGIMKANWEPADFAAMRQRRLRFSPAQARNLGDNLVGRRERGSLPSGEPTPFLDQMETSTELRLIR